MRLSWQRACCVVPTERLEPRSQVGSRFTGADAVDLEYLVIASSGGLAYTVGFERSHVSVDGGPLHDMTLRVTHIYRRIDGHWKLIHRHADFPAPDPRKASAG